MAHAEREFELAQKDETGSTLRETLIGARDRTKSQTKRAEYEAQLASPPLPPALEYIWEIFTRLRRRIGGGFGPGPISWADIDAFTRHSRFEFVPWELELIEDLDDTYLKVLAEHKSV